ncbi:L,D-transpeptidase family protein [Bifidobacterium sp. SMB2]|uniref:L,D-transpeptidase family protein n=1 Tax=Bifidobacterium saimiriisciurei TaxID=2661627 RepID=A0ABX0C987_9BIFI|nr:MULTISPECIES: L,D-transpeptidase [Bifidobacterium]NEG96101.1 L,D-transpeptidase family protein [Bifidobacterium sp. SMB2]NEH10821.1 L,D-transpeptidase family protein [Bifidobacterium saimiriisciurei]
MVFPRISDAKGRTPARRTILSMIASFLRLFDKPTRALIIACGIVTVVALAVVIPKGPEPLLDDTAPVVEQVDMEKRTTTPTASVKRAKAVPSPKPTTPSWQMPSGGAHVDLRKVRDLNVRVSIAEQKTYILSGKTVVYTMRCSTGMKGSTPTGRFKVQNRGEDFFNPNENMGAKYWVSWANYGEYLFHSVPTDRQGRYIVSEAEKLGRPASHGCVRLTVADAKWLYEQLPVDTPVTIG